MYSYASNFVRSDIEVNDYVSIPIASCVMVLFSLLKALRSRHHRNGVGHIQRAAV